MKIEVYHIGNARQNSKHSTKGRRCGRKRQYYNKDTAFAVIRRMLQQQKRLRRLEVYECEYCTEKATSNGKLPKRISRKQASSLPRMSSS